MSVNKSKQPVICSGIWSLKQSKLTRPFKNKHSCVSISYSPFSYSSFSFLCPNLFRCMINMSSYIYLTSLFSSSRLRHLSSHPLSKHFLFQTVHSSSLWSPLLTVIQIKWLKALTDTTAGLLNLCNMLIHACLTIIYTCIRLSTLIHAVVRLMFSAV